MTRCVGDMGTSASVSLAHKLQRHREILSDCRNEYRKIKTSITSAREHAELVQSVRHDIAYGRTRCHAPARAWGVLGH